MNRNFIHFSSMVVLGLAAGFLAVSTYAFSTGTAVDLGFAGAIGIAAVGLTMTYAGLRRGRRLFPLLGLATMILAGWTILATAGTFADDTARWIAFGSALGYAGLSAVNLLLHEITTERVVHHLEVGARREAGTRRRARRPVEVG